MVFHLKPFHFSLSVCKLIPAFGVGLGSNGLRGVVLASAIGAVGAVTSWQVEVVAARVQYDICPLGRHPHVDPAVVLKLRGSRCTL